MALLLPGVKAQALLEVFVIPGSMALLLPGGEGTGAAQRINHSGGPWLCCFQEVKALLEKAESADCRAGLLRFIAAFSMCMSPRGVDTDVRHILVLVLLVGRLDDPDSALRCTAAQLLIGESLYPLWTQLHVSAGPLSIGTGATADGSTVCSCSPEGPCRLLHQ